MEGGHGEQRAESQHEEDLSSWSLDLVLMFSVTLVHLHVLSVGTVLDRQHNRVLAM